MSAARGCSSSPAVRRSGSDGATSTSASIDSSTSWRPRWPATCSASKYIDLRYTNGFAVGWADDGHATGRRLEGRRAPPREVRGVGRRDDRKLIVGLDIGTSKVVAIVGEISAEDRLEVIGIGSNPSRGLKRGVVVNIESTVQSIQRAVEEAELMAGCEINSVIAGIAGSHVRSLNSHGIVAIRDKEVSAERRRARHRRRARRGDPGRSARDPRVAAGVHHRLAGGDPRADRHVRRAARGEGASRDGCRERRAERRQVRAALRTHGRGHRARAAWRRATPC